MIPPNMFYLILFSIEFKWLFKMFKIVRKIIKKVGKGCITLRLRERQIDILRKRLQKKDNKTSIFKPDNFFVYIFTQIYF